MSTEVKKTGRLQYIDPTNLTKEKGVDYYVSENKISFPYEDYCIAIDLTIRMTNRYSCGLASENGLQYEFTASTRDNSISFLRGTSIDGSEEGFLTTNFTDVSMTNPGTNTSETLGIESINITYEKNLFPLVTIKFVDVRGATLMQPVEAGYYNQKSLGNSWHVYRGFFTMPYPMFILKVKGFYGKGVTYRLVPIKNDLEFDSETGNFNITSTLTGYMYGIYSDLPLSYLAIAPYTPEGETYWEKKVNDKTFVFKDAYGNPAQKMIKLPELREKIAMASMNLESICEARDDNAELVEIDEEIRNINDILALYPFNEPNWETSGNHRIYKSTYDELENIREKVGNYHRAIYEYSESFNNGYANIFKTLRKLETVHTYSKSGETIVKQDATLNAGFINKVNISINKFNKEELQYGWFHQHYDSGTSIYTITYTGPDIKAEERIIHTITRRLDSLEEMKIKLEKENKLREDERTEKLIGFRPSVRNIFELIFAHMDTFMYVFYSSMRKIRSQIDSNDSARKKITYSATGDDDTDTGRFKEDNSTSSLLYNNFLPPFTAFYKYASNTSKNGENKRKESVWPGEFSIKAESLEECCFIKELLEGSYIYSNKDYEVEKRIKSIKEGAKGDSSDIMVEGVPSINISNFIPLTIADYMYKDEIGNPYLVVKNFINQEGNDNTDITDLIMGIYALRAYYYLATEEASVNDNSRARAFGFIDAINLYKALGDNSNEKFLQFLRKYAITLNNDDVSIIDDLISSITQTANTFWAYNGTPFFYISEGNGYAGTASRGYLWYFNNYIPIINFDTQKRKQDYIFWENLAGDYHYLNVKPFENVDTNCVKIIKSRDYIDIIQKSIEIELSSQNSNSIESAGYRHGGIYSDDIPAWILDNNYYKGGLVGKSQLEDIISVQYIKDDIVYDFNGNAVKGVTCDNLLKSGDLSELEKYWIKYPSFITNNYEDYNAYSLKEINTIFDAKFLYHIQKDIEAKAFLFLQSLPINVTSNIGSKRVENAGIIGRVFNGEAPKAVLLREGSYYWYLRESAKVEGGDLYEKPDPEKKETYICKEKDFYISHIYMSPIMSGRITIGDAEYAQWTYPEGCKLSRINKLIEYFKDWANNEFAIYEPMLVDTGFYTYGDRANGLSLDVLKKGSRRDRAMSLQKFLRDLFFGVDIVLDTYIYNYDTKGGYISDDKKNFVYCSVYNMRQAFAGFIEGLNNIYGAIIERAAGSTQAVIDIFNKNIANSPFLSRDVKTSTYFTLKSLYDKWLCAPQHGPKTWELSKYNIKSDFNNFIYVDTYYHDIGDLFTINLSKLSEWLSQCLPTSNTNANGNILANNNKSIYEFLHQTAADSGALLLAVPQKIGTYNTSDIKDMFTPFSIHENWDTDSSTFIFMYTYKPSEHLGDADNSFDMNGWSENGDAVDLTDEKIAGAVFGDGGFEVPAFGITYAKQNQSLFKNIRLNNQNAGLSEVAIAGTMNVASTEAEGPRESVLFGQDIYKTLSQYAFKCSAEMMGNMQITPLLYFQLNNIPFWKGGYQILKVNHNITAGNMTTSFEGVRINRHAIPMADNTLFAVSGNIGRRDSNGNIVWDNSIGNGVKNISGDSSFTISDKIDFDEKNVSNTTPIISLTPAHGPYTSKSLEWAWSSKVVDKMVEILKEYKYPNGTNYNVQRCNKDDKYTSVNGYNITETKHLISRFGSDCVIHIAPHWNGGGGKYYLMILDYEDKIRDDSRTLANYLKASVETVLKTNENMLPKTISSSIKIRSMDDIIKNRNGVKDENHDDGAPRLDCACVLTENWFADWDYINDSGATSTWELYGGTIERYNNNLEKCKDLFCTKLLEDNMIELIAKMHAEGIRKYIDSLS